MAIAYCHTHRILPQDSEDLAGEALVKALGSWDPTKGTKFSTFTIIALKYIVAGHWSEQARCADEPLSGISGAGEPAPPPEQEGGVDS